MSSDIIIDFQSYGLNVKDTSTVDDVTIKSLGEEVVRALKDFGYCYIKNHGVEERFIKNYFEASGAFYGLRDEVKDNFKIGSDYAFGWVRLEGEKCDPKSEANDLHEAFNYRPKSGYEAWPNDAQVQKFETLTKDMFKMGTELGYRFCDVLSLGLNKPKNYLRNAHKLVGQKGNSSAVRTLYYPPITKANFARDRQSRISEHTDFGTITLGFQDETGGLEIRTSSGDFIPSDPIPGTAYLYAGAMIQRWTADEIKATSHRIPIPEDEHRKRSARQAFQWYLDPDDEYVIRCIDGSEKYSPITHREYINNRIHEAMPWLDPTVEKDAN